MREYRHRFTKNRELRLPWILGFFPHSGVRLTEYLAEFGKMAEMGLGEGLWAADGLRGYFDLLYASRTHGSSSRRGLVLGCGRAWPGALFVPSHTSQNKHCATLGY